MLQMTEIPVIYNLGANTITETNISNPMKFTSGLTASSIDIAFLSRNKDLICGIIEVRNVEPDFRNSANRRNIEQLGAYMLSAQAFSQWGVGSKPRTESIIGLLVYPTAIYRLSIMKPADGEITPFGLSHSLEYTNDQKMMAWVVEKYVRGSVSDYLRLNEDTLDKYVDPKSWTSVNFDLEKGLSRYVSFSATNMGFLFRSNATNLNRLIGLPGMTTDSYIIGGEIPDEELIVKYISALLTSPPKQYYYFVKTMIGLEIEQRELKSRLQAEDAALDTLSKQLRKIVLDEKEKILIQDLLDRIQLLRPKKVQTYSEEGTATSPSESNLIVVEATSAAGEKTKCDNAGEHDTVQSLFPTNMLGVKHPYIGIVIFAYFHPLLIMRNVGTSLALLIENVEFRSNWKHNIWLRQRFAYDIGLSALNLITNFHLCHNDIRPPNIAVKGDSFCLIDFDLCSDDLLDSCILSRLVMLVPDSTIDALKMKQMMLTVSQMAFVVFTLETFPESDALSEMNRYWLTDQNLAKPRSQAQLNLWAKSKGPMVEHLFSGDPSALDATQIDRDYFIRLLDAILTLKGAQAAHF
jgi:hypothetical protein